MRNRPSRKLPRRCQDARADAAQAEAAELRGLLLPQNLLCALELDEPCTTFRPNRPEGLVPPRQPVLLMRPPRWASQTVRG